MLSAQAVVSQVGDAPSESGSDLKKSSAKPFYRPELDVVRFFAFMGVFISHSHAGNARLWVAIVAFGRYGVCLFFLLSAYLITELLRRERLKTGSLDMKKFYLRRVLRIWPLYFLVIALSVLLGLIHPVWHVEGMRVLSSMLLAGNWYIMLYGWSVNPLMFPLWSISVEEQFYLVTPTLAKLGGSIAVSVFSVLALGISYLTLWHMPLDVPQGAGAFANSLVQFQFFAAGSLIAIFLRGEAPKIGKLYRVLMTLGGLGLWVVANRLGISVHLKANATHLTPVLGWLAILGGTTLIFLSLLGASDVRFPRWLIYLGSISYGLYVYHVGIIFLMVAVTTRFSLIPAIPIVATFLSLGLTCLVAGLSYRFFELPFIHLKKRFTLVASRPE